MTKITTVGLDLAKNVFQGHAVDAGGDVVVRRQVRPLVVIDHDQLHAFRATVSGAA